MSLEIFAKLLATENISLIRGDFQTASFDLEKRIVRVPNFVNMSEQEEDLMVFHEIGHALFTPAKYVAAVLANKKKPNFGQYLNVVEDARIERKIKETYPGSKKTFFSGYQSLMDREFFGCTRRGVNRLCFIDRINLHCKVGFLIGAAFSEEELVLVKKVETTSSFEEVLEVAKEIYKFASVVKKQKAKISKKKKDESFDGEESSNEDSGDETSSDSSDAEEDSSDAEEDSSVSNDEPDAGADKIPEKASTVENLEKNLSRNVNTEVINYVDPILENGYHFYPFNFLYFRAKEFGVFETEWKDNSPKQYRDSCRRAASYLHREFELRKAAELHTRTMVAQSGSLDASKLSSYKTSTNLFKKYNIQPKGKNHGVVLLVDMSSSMSDCISSSMQEIYTMVSFCKMAGIPFEVYAFSDPLDLSKEEQKKFLVSSKEIENKNLISGNQAGVYHIASSSVPWQLVEKLLLKLIIRPQMARKVIKMLSTPLTEAFVAMADLIPAFKKKYNLEKVVLVTITDGESNECYSSGNRSYRSNDFLRDQKSGKTFVLGNQRNRYIYKDAVLEYLKFTMPWMKTIGFFIVGTFKDYRDISKFVNAYSETYKGEIKKVWKRFENSEAVELRKKAVDGVIQASARGYDSMMLFVGGRILEDFQLGQQNSDVKSGQLAQNFMKAMKQGIQNKTVLSTVAKVMG